MGEFNPIEKREAILEQLEAMLSTSSFRRAERSTALLRYIVEQAVAGRTEQLKEYTLGVEALGRGDSFDPRTDPIVRAEASRLRSRLEQYYANQDHRDSIVFALPKGSYIPQFLDRSPQKNSLAAVAAAPPFPTPILTGRVRLLGLLAVVLLVLVAAFFGLRVRPPDTGINRLQRFEVELKSGGVLGSQVGIDVLITPDGSRVVFVARDSDGVAHIYTRRLDLEEVVRLPGTDGARSLFLSPDGQWVGFWAAAKLQKVAVNGGSPVILCDAPDLLGASWGNDGVIIAALNSKLWRVPETSKGELQAVLDLSEEEGRSPVWPQWLPGDRALVYTVFNNGGADSFSVEALSLRDGKRRVLVRGGTYGRYISPGHLVYVNQGTLYTMPFDAEQLEVHGAAVPILNDVSYSRTFGYAQLDVSQNGIFLYRKSDEGGLLVAEWIDRSGKRTAAVSKPGRYSWPAISPDGRSLALSSTESGETNISIHHLQDGASKRLAAPAKDHYGLVWMPDNRNLLFGGMGISKIDVERLDRAIPLTTTQAIQIAGSIADDGHQIAYAQVGLATGLDVWTASLSDAARGLEAAKPYLQTKAIESHPALSPDGRWIAYVSNESGAPEVYAQRFPDDGYKVTISTGGDSSTPRWSPNGREILYRNKDRQVVVRSYRIEGKSLMLSPPRLWAPLTLADTGVLPNFAVAPDGERIVALMPAARSEDRQSANHVTMIVQFADELRRLSP